MHGINIVNEEEITQDWQKFIALQDQQIIDDLKYWMELKSDLSTIVELDDCYE